MPLRPAPLALVVVMAARFVSAGELDLQGVLSARGMLVEGQRSWLEGGFGRLGESGGRPGDALFT